MKHIRKHDISIKIPVSIFFATSVLTGCNTTHNAPASGQKPADSSIFTGDFDFGLSAGYEYNSVVSIEDVEEITGGKDSLLNLRGAVEYEQDIGKNTEISVGYTYRQKTHDTFSRFDRQNHYLSTGIEHDFGKTEVGVQYRAYDGNRDNDGFVFSNRIRTYMETEISDDLELDVFYVFEDKEYDQSASLDAKDHEIGGQLTWFLDDFRQYVQLRYIRENSDAFGPQFDYDADKIRAAYTQRFKVRDKDLRARISWSYDMRDYDNITPSIGVIREDNRQRFGIDLRYPIWKNVDINADYQRANYDSNLPSADYNRDRVRFGLDYDF